VELKIVDGEYVSDENGGVNGLSGSGEVLARVLFRLTARRGAMPFLPNLGSRLYQIRREKPSVRQALAAQYVAEALEDETDLNVTSVEWTESGEDGTLTVRMDWQGETLETTVTV
jgi:phage gp46-like protein